MRHKAKPSTVGDFLDQVDRQSFQRMTGICTQSVTRALQDGVLPDRWFWRTRNFCEELGIPTPEHLFRSYEAPSCGGSA